VYFKKQIGKKDWHYIQSTASIPPLHELAFQFTYSSMRSPKSEKLDKYWQRRCSKISIPLWSASVSQRILSPPPPLERVTSGNYPLLADTLSPDTIRVADDWHRDNDIGFRDICWWPAYHRKATALYNPDTRNDVATTLYEYTIIVY
jgi:hypothetical protein